MGLYSGVLYCCFIINSLCSYSKKSIVTANDANDETLYNIQVYCHIYCAFVATENENLDLMTTK